MLLERDIDHRSDSNQGTDYMVMYSPQIQNLNGTIGKWSGSFEYCKGSYKLHCITFSLGHVHYFRCQFYGECKINGLTNVQFGFSTLQCGQYLIWTQPVLIATKLRWPFNKYTILDLMSFIFSNSCVQKTI